MKVKELKGDLVGVKIKIPKKYQDRYMKIKKEMYLFSWWGKGVWLKNSMKENQVYPLVFNTNNKELLEFTVIKGQLNDKHYGNR